MAYWPHVAIRHAAAINVQSMRMFSTTCIHAKLRQFDDEPNFQIGESFGLQNVETFEFQFGESFGLKSIKSFPARKLARVSSSTLILKVGNLCTGIGMGKCMLLPIENACFSPRTIACRLATIRSCQPGKFPWVIVGQHTELGRQWTRCGQPRRVQPTVARL